MARELTITQELYDKLHREEFKEAKNRVFELEKIFSEKSDNAYDEAEVFTKAGYEGIETWELNEILESYNGAEKELFKMYGLNEEHIDLTETRHPNYEKYVTYVFSVISGIEMEIAKRNGRTGNDNPIIN